MTYGAACTAIVVIVLIYVSGIGEAGFLWFEDAPNPDDPCVLTISKDVLFCYFFVFGCGVS